MEGLLWWVGGIVIVGAMAAVALLLAAPVECPHCGSADTHATDAGNLLSNRYCNGCRKMYGGPLR